eukprot:TRINITY_DN3656_c0_g1_i1.p1 TRINITY_DN3656_c0_g1~~TRINITY_DN3656_c0_g1_i1.p1  ORF type:complete len:292 (+),score=83.98 TRINITY_DN3656_c0_g1_i1:51-926(+)
MIPLYAYLVLLVLSALLIIALITLVYRMAPAVPKTEARVEDNNNVPANNNNRRARGRATIRRRRARGAENEQDDQSDEDQDSGNEGEIEKIMEQRRTGKIGTKKAMKLQRKEEAKQQRLEMEEARERRKQLEEKERTEEEERERAEEEAKNKRRQELRELAQQKLAKEKEEFAKWRDTFEVEGAGSNKQDQQLKRERLATFGKYIKEKKVVKLEELAIEFDVKTSEVVSEIKRLQKRGELDGVIDERGKFIFIMESEWDAIADFIKWQGRVSLTEIAEESNRLINLNPEKA